MEFRTSHYSPDVEKLLYNLTLRNGCVVLDAIECNNDTILGKSMITIVIRPPAFILDITHIPTDVNGITSKVFQCCSGKQDRCVGIFSCESQLGDVIGVDEDGSAMANYFSTS